VLRILYQRYINVLTRLVGFSIRHAIALVLIVTFVSVLMLRYTVAHISINTDTQTMLDPNLPFRKASEQFAKAFPNLSGEVVVIVESAHAGDAEDAAAQLATDLRQHSNIVQSVYQPGAGEYFDTHGLLYLSSNELWDLDERLADAEPMLGAMARDPSLRGLLDTMSKAFTDSDGGHEQLLTKMFDRVSGVLEKQLEGKPEAVHWRDELFPPEAKKVAANGKPKPQRAFLLARPRLDYSSLEPADAALNLIHSLIDKLQASNPALRVRVTGSVAMDSEELVTVSRDAKLTTSLSFGLVCLLLIWGLRSAGAVIGVLITLAIGLVWTAAFAIFAIGALNLISVCFAVLFIGMGVDFGIQFAMRYLEECDRGREKIKALQQAASGVGGALTLAAVGAAISFLAFVPTSYRGLAELGIISAVSMLVALIANLTILPAILSLLRRPSPRASAAMHTAGNEHSLVFRHRRAILLVSVVIVIAGVLLLPRARFDFNPLNLKDAHTDSVAAFKELAEDVDSTPYTIAVLSKNLAEAEQTSAKLSKLDVVDKVVNLNSYVPGDQVEKLQIIDGMRTALQAALDPPTVLPPPSLAEQTKALQDFHNALKVALAKVTDASLHNSMERLDAALGRLESASGWPDQIVAPLQELLLGDLKPTMNRLRKLMMAEAASIDILPQDLRERYVASDGRARIEVYPKQNLNDNVSLGQFVRAVQKVVPDATDSPVELLEASDAVIWACIQASLLALLLTILMHIKVLHGLADALLVAAPLVLAMLLTVATSVVFNTPFNFANIIALPLLIGLNNAYGAYLVIRGHGEGNITGLMNSSTPRAVMFSGLTAIASFGVLAVSKHPGMASMGVLISLSLTFALLSALIVLPAIMAELHYRHGIKSDR
jgi:hopanoid biosynthesis associated RND transporter like protein HpnN